MRVAYHVLILSGLLTLTVGARLVNPDYYKRDLRAIAAKATLRRAEDIESAWKTMSYTEMTSIGVEEAFIAKVDWKSLQLNQIQEEKLKVRVQELFQYFRNPEFQKYYRLKTDGLHYEFSPSIAVSNLLATAVLRSRFVGQPGPEESSRVLWDLVHKKQHDFVLPQVTAISLNSVVAAITGTNSGPALLAGPAKNGFTIGVEAFDPGFRYETTAKSQSKPLFFEMSFLVRMKVSDSVGPLHVSLIWLERDQNWGLNRLIVDNWLKVSTLF